MSTDTLFVTRISRLAGRYGHINWALFDQGLVSGSNVLTGILLARFLGADGFGIYSLAWAILLLVASVHLPLIVGSMMSIGPKHTAEDAPGYYGAVIVHNLAVAVAGAAIVMITAEVSGRLVPAWDIQGLALPLAAATFATVWQEFFRRYFYTRGRPASAFAVDASRYVVQIAVLIGCFLLAPGAIDAGTTIWIIAAAAALPAVISLNFLGAVQFSARTIRSVWVRHYHASKWMVMSQPIEWASEYVFMFAAGTFLGTGAVGALRASQNVAAMTNILFLSLINVVPARASRHLHEGGEAAMSGYLKRVTFAAGGATAAVCLILAVAPEFWLRLLFGEEFAQFGEILRWWSLYYVINFFALPLRSAFRAMEKTRPVFIAQFIGACFAVLAAVLVVPWLGLRGAVIGAVATKAIATGWLGHLYRKSMSGQSGA